MTTRREVLRSAMLLGGAALLGTRPAEAQETAACSICPNLAYSRMLGWSIGPQIYSFKNFPFEEAIKMVKQTGAIGFELYRGQKLTKDGDDKVGPGMSKEAFKRFRGLCAEAGCVPHAMGVTGFDRAHFDFAASVGIGVLNVEPGFDKIPEINKLAAEYRISVGLHNHPKPSIYWDPDIVLKQLADSDSWIGACCDTGHWVRSGLDPLECVKKFKGRIVSFHIKDLNDQKRDIPLGKGVCKIADILKECAAQNVRAPFSIEYESDWDKNMPLVAEGIKFFNETAKAIVLES